MQLRGIEFGNILAASGVQGFFGEGYWFHLPLRPLGLDLSGVTFVSKTATLAPYKGNMPLTRWHTPRAPFPACIKVRPLRGVVLNAVGLSNPGLRALLQDGRWQSRTEPFFISLTSRADTRKSDVKNSAPWWRCSSFSRETSPHRLGCRSISRAPMPGATPQRSLPNR